MPSTHELMVELADICALRDEAMDRYDETQADEDARVYESAEIRLQDWLDRDAPEKLAALLALKSKRKATAAWRKEEARRWQAHAKRAEASAQWLDTLALQLLRRAQTVTGKPRLDLPGGRRAEAKIRTTQRVEVHNVDEIPDNFVRVKREADKVAIKRELKAGRAVAGAQLVSASRDCVSVTG